MTLSGAHSIIYSTNPDADRAFLRDVLELPNVDVGGGWLIFALPPAEVAVHPGDTNNRHELYLMCDDIEAFVAAMTPQGIVCGPVSNQGWGLLSQITLPGGGTLGIYQPRHARPAAMSDANPGGPAGKPPGRATAKRAVSRTAARPAKTRTPVSRTKKRAPANRAKKAKGRRR